MTKPIAEQVAELVVGEHYEARFDNERSVMTIQGELEFNSALELYIDETYIADDENNPHPNLTSITRVPRPIPSEPEVGSFGLRDDGKAFQRLDEDAYARRVWRVFDNPVHISWEALYPSITRIFTPSGDEVTGFEYYKSEGN